MCTLNGAKLKHKYFWCEVSFKLKKISEAFLSGNINSIICYDWSRLKGCNKIICALLISQLLILCASIVLCVCVCSWNLCVSDVRFRNKCVRPFECVPVLFVCVRSRTRAIQRERRVTCVSQVSSRGIILNGRSHYGGERGTVKPFP